MPCPRCCRHVVPSSTDAPACVCGQKRDHNVCLDLGWGTPDGTPSSYRWLKVPRWLADLLSPLMLSLQALEFPLVTLVSWDHSRGPDLPPRLPRRTFSAPRMSCPELPTHPLGARASRFPGEHIGGRKSLPPGLSLPTLTHCVPGIASLQLCGVGLVPHTVGTSLSWNCALGGQGPGVRPGAPR